MTRKETVLAVLALIAFLAVLGLLTGCTVPPPPAPAAPEGPVIVLSPPPVPMPDTPAAVSVKRDTAVLRRQARQWLALPSVPAEAALDVEPLTGAMTSALRTMEAHHTRRGYRPADLANARAAANALAAYLSSQDARK